VEKADTRASALCSINPQLALSDKLNVTDYKTKIAETRGKLNSYNTLLSEADAALTALERSETELADLSERMLKGVASKFGRDSVEYEKAGGVRKSKIKKSPRNNKNVTDLKKVA
jgi:hypothetical protein